MFFLFFPKKFQRIKFMWTKHRLVSSICIMRFSSFNSIQWSFVVVDVVVILLLCVAYTLWYSSCLFQILEKNSNNFNSKHTLSLALILSSFVFDMNELYCVAFLKSTWNLQFFLSQNLWRHPIKISDRVENTFSLSQLLIYEMSKNSKHPFIPFGILFLFFYSAFNLHWSGLFCSEFHRVVFFSLSKNTGLSATVQRKKRWW